MNKETHDGDQLLGYEKVSGILMILLAIATIVFVILSETDMLSGKPQMLCAGLTVLCSAIHNWRKQRGIAILSLCCAVFMLGFVIVSAVL